MNKIHRLKTWPNEYAAVRDGRKTFEVRKNDRDFIVGDVLVLEEYDPATVSYSERSVVRRVDYILPGDQFGIAPGFVVMSLGLV